jgi:protease-4
VLVLIFLAIVLLFFVFASFSTALVGQCVAVIDVNAPLTVEGAPMTLFDMGYPSSEELATTIEGLNMRDDVGAIVFVINSPGGSVVATREVYNAIQELDKPSVSYFREVAASGAYYVASGTDYIVSDPDAITGSIGVIATFTQMSGLFEKIGINVTTIKSGDYKDIGSPYRNVTEDEQKILQELVDEVYQEFHSVVLNNRKGKLDLVRFSEVADGRILTGRQAEKVGLVDETGTKKDAIKKAADLADIPYDKYGDIRICKVETMPTDTGLFGVDGIIRKLEVASELPKLQVIR